MGNILTWGPFFACLGGGGGIKTSLNNKRYTFNTTVNFEMMTKLFKMFENMHRSNLNTKCSKENAKLIEPYNAETLITYLVLH